MQILRVSNKEKEVIKSGNLILLKEKIEEAEALWFKKLRQEKTDYRHVQGVYAVIADLLEVLN